MILKKTYPFYLLLLTVGFLSFSLPKKIEKKVKKQIEKTFYIKDYSIESLVVSKEINKKLHQKITSENLFKISDNESVIGYAYIAKAPSKTDEFDYLILLDKDLIIVKTKILIYREDYGGEIGSKRWLKQFIGKKSTDKLQYEKDIVAISGATISAVSMTIAVNTFLQDLEVLHQNMVL